MNRILIGLLLLASLSPFAKTQDDKISAIQEIISSNELNVDNYHYGRLKGYLEALNLENGFKLVSTITEADYRINLVVLKKAVEVVTEKYPEVNIKKTIKSITVIPTKNSFGGCNILKGNLEISARGDLLGADFTTYTKPQIEACARKLLEAVEANLIY